MRRTDRLYALVEELRARAPRPVSRAELADRLEVTGRTVERDILALQQSGVPIWSQRGRGGGYAIDAQWSLPPLNFDATEALAVIAALASARSMPFAEAGRRAEQKILAAMTAGEASKAKELANRVRLGSFGSHATQHIISAVEEAVVGRKVVELGYRDREGAVTSRPVEAHGVHVSPSGSYLMGWCRMRDAARAFRLDRIVSVRTTPEDAPPRDIDGFLDWDEAAPPDAATEGERQMPPTAAGSQARRTRGGPPRRTDNRTGSSPAFARAIAGSLPSVDATTRRGRTSFATGGSVFLVVRDADESMEILRADGDAKSFLLPRVGRDEVRTAIEDGWSALAPKRTATAYAKRRQRWLDQPAVTHDDIRAFLLSLPGVEEAPIWGNDLGFRVGNEKRNRFAKFGPPEGSGIGNLLPPDDEDTLLIFRCAQRPALLSSRPDLFFTTPHYGDPTEPGGVVVRLAEHRGDAALREITDLLEHAWRQVATPEQIAELEAR